MSNAGKIFGKGISFPPRVGADGRVVWSEFGGGLNRFLFEPNTATTRQLIRDRITKALAQWEPRIAIESVAVEPDAQDPQAAIATIHYKLVATQTSERVSLSVTLGG